MLRKRKQNLPKRSDSTSQDGSNNLTGMDSDYFLLFVPFTTYFHAIQAFIHLPLHFITHTELSLN